MKKKKKKNKGSINIAFKQNNRLSIKWVSLKKYLYIFNSNFFPLNISSAQINSLN
jgi:hypothetical protein